MLLLVRRQPPHPWLQPWQRPRQSSTTILALQTQFLLGSWRWSMLSLSVSFAWSR